ncbi:MAG: argininosuccinate lyase [Candidatus Dormibacteraeota bacterium]|nr:argininosuccinate lyase [Candidatus Dormibacteraeota bacterium]
MSRQTGKLYSGRFEEGLLPELEQFSSSLQQDLRLAPFDVRGSLAHARGLHAAGILAEGDLRAIEQGLKQVAAELDSGTFAFQETDEDIHTAVERRLTELAPDAGSRLHAGRSRNDQVALDLRLWCRAACGALARDLAGLIEALADQALRNAQQPMPGYTHLQRAQPVTVGYHLLAHAEPLLRDAERVRHAYEAADRMPLGSGALAGSTLSLPRELVAEELGFGGLTENTMDAVSDRDFELDLVYACATIGIHLSRLGEDVVLWASSEFGFVQLPDRIATGSSIMPQKKNPDIAELIRGRTGRAIGSLTALATVLKGLPLTYDRDLQEDKVALFAAVDNALDCLGAARLLVLNLEFDGERLSRSLDDPGLLATDSAEQLVAEGVPFREAHRRVAAQVREGRQRSPWSAEQSLRLRRLDPVGRAQQVRRRSVGLRRWGDQHPPQNTDLPEAR